MSKLDFTLVFFVNSCKSLLAPCTATQTPAVAQVAVSKSNKSSESTSQDLGEALDQSDH